MANSSSALIPSSTTFTLRREVPYMDGSSYLSLLKFVIDSISGKLEDIHVKKWSWESEADSKQGFMRPGKPREFQRTVGHLSKL